MHNDTTGSLNKLPWYRRRSSVPLIVMGLVALGYAVYRAVVLSFTHDESFSFLYYAHRSTYYLLQLYDPYTNNHILNSIGMKWSSRTFGPSEWALRMPNLLLLVVYLFYTIRYLRERPLLLALPGFIILVCNTELLGMFALARGYGMSIGFMWAAMFHYAASIREGGRRHLVAFHLASILAIYSNFTQLDFYAAALVCYYPIAWFVRTGQAERLGLWRRTWWANAGMVLLAFALLAVPVQRMLEGNQLNFGGKTGFWDCTVRTVIYTSTAGYTVSTKAFPLYQGLVGIIALLAVAIITTRIPLARREGLRRDPLLLCFTVVLVAISVLSVVQHHLFKADLLKDRFALFLMPLFFMVFVQSMFSLAQGGGRWVAAPLLIIAASFAIVGSFRKAFPPIVGEWYYDVQTDEAMHMLEQHHQEEGTVTIGNNWVFEPTINFYRLQRKLTWLRPAHRNGPSPGDDYRYLLLDGLRPEDTQGYETIGRFDRAGAVLLKRRHPRSPSGS